MNLAKKHLWLVIAFCKGKIIIMEKFMKTLVFIFVLGTFSFASASFQKHAKLFSIVNQKDISGFSIKKTLPKKHPLRKLGVKKGDIVTAVDSNPIYDNATALAAYEKKNVSMATVLRHKNKMILRRQ